MRVDGRDCRKDSGGGSDGQGGEDDSGDLQNEKE
jgi:hypothetical protein